MSERFDISSTTLKRFTDESAKLGEDIGVVTGAMEQWLERVEEAQQETGEGAAVFEELGIAVRDASGEYKDSEDLLFEYADTLSRLEDQQKAEQYLQGHWEAMVLNCCQCSVYLVRKAE